MAQWLAIASQHGYIWLLCLLWGQCTLALLALYSTAINLLWLPLLLLQLWVGPALISTPIKSIPRVAARDMTNHYFLGYNMGSIENVTYWNLCANVEEKQYLFCLSMCRYLTRKPWANRMARQSNKKKYWNGHIVPVVVVIAMQEKGGREAGGTCYSSKSPSNDTRNTTSPPFFHNGHRFLAKERKERKERKSPLPLSLATSIPPILFSVGTKISLLLLLLLLPTLVKQSLKTHRSPRKWVEGTVVNI